MQRRVWCGWHARGKGRERRHHALCALWRVRKIGLAAGGKERMLACVSTRLCPLVFGSVCPFSSQHRLQNNGNGRQRDYFGQCTKVEGKQKFEEEFRAGIGFEGKHEAVR